MIDQASLQEAGVMPTAEIIDPSNDVAVGIARRVRARPQPTFPGNDARYRRAIPGARYQIATRTPSSTTRSDGMRKNSVAGTALRASTRNSHNRHSGIFGAIAGTIKI